MKKAIEIAEKQLVRGLVLEIVQQSATIATIRGVLKGMGYLLTKDEVRAACDYLRRKGLVEVKEVRNERAGIFRTTVITTSAGIDFLDGVNEVEGVE